MANQRAEGQEIITLWMDRDLLAAIEVGRRRLRGISRSQFIRDAVDEKLHGLEIAVPLEKVTAPNRVRQRQQSSAALNEGAAPFGAKPSSETDAAAAKLARKAVAEVLKHNR